MTVIDGSSSPVMKADRGDKDCGADLGRRRRWRLKPLHLPPDFKLFVGSLPFSVDSAQLAELFENVGTLMVEGWFSDFHVIYDKMIERRRCFGVVTMSLIEQAETAKQQIDGCGRDYNCEVVEMSRGEALGN
ncbi:hypothetical protein PIB30_020747 [Stylosanthes scabra]|uniref:RRM domain-containing protein n=1 Tax=Stylosanthes scabra TaxID=79078 RepID=A0ABU6Z705_9FABA|nr:hypothetical protein [Stylosanthes scabra]